VSAAHCNLFFTSSLTNQITQLTSFTQLARLLSGLVWFNLPGSVRKSQLPPPPPGRLSSYQIIELTQLIVTPPRLSNIQSLNTNLEASPKSAEVFSLPRLVKSLQDWILATDLIPTILSGSHQLQHFSTKRRATLELQLDLEPTKLDIPSMCGVQSAMVYCPNCRRYLGEKVTEVFPCVRFCGRYRERLVCTWFYADSSVDCRFCNPTGWGTRLLAY